MWTVIYIATGNRTLDRIKSRLEQEGFLVKVRQIHVHKEQFEILVPETELEEVQEVLREILIGQKV